MQTELMNYDASDVLHAFYWDAPFNFLGSAFITVALVAAAFSALRRSLDPLLIYFALFAGIHGLRLRLRASLVRVTLKDFGTYHRLEPGLNYLILIPAFLFFASPGLRTRADRQLNCTHGVLALATFAFGNRGIYDQINNIVLILQKARTTNSYPRQRTRYERLANESVTTYGDVMRGLRNGLEPAEISYELRWNHLRLAA
jgi:hypothetical protein